MNILRYSLFIIALLLVFVGCSNSNSGDVEVESSSTGEGESDELEVSEIEELEDEMGISEGDDDEVRAKLPSDIFVTEDMEIELTVENELMSQLHYKTDKSLDELSELYSDYLNGSSDISEVEENVIDYPEYNSYVVMYTAMFDGDTFEIVLTEDENVGEYRTVGITRYDDEVLDEMIEEMQEQMEED